MRSTQGVDREDLNIAFRAANLCDDLLVCPQCECMHKLSTCDAAGTNLALAWNLESLVAQSAACFRAFLDFLKRPLNRMRPEAQASGLFASVGVRLEMIGFR